LEAWEAEINSTGKIVWSDGHPFGIVLLHEFGHCFASRWVGGERDEIMMTPLGGLALPKRRTARWRLYHGSRGARRQCFDLRCRGKSRFTLMTVMTP